MKSARLMCLLAAVTFAASLLTDAFAQQTEKSVVAIRKIEVKKVKTPEYQLLTGQFMSQTRDWFTVNTSYETDPKWTDELTFTYYILIKGKTAEQPKYTLLRGDVTYINIQKGKHKSDAYVHPSTMARFGDPERVAVVIASQGKVLGMDSLPSAGNQRWWEQLAPVDGMVLSRMQTPFAMISFDDYEAVKPLTAGR